MGHMLPTLLVLLTAVPLATAQCTPHTPAPYYVSLLSNTCVNDREHASQGPGPILLYGTKDECCNGLTPKERRECLKTEVLSEVYPDFEEGRCASDTLRPAVVHPACGVTATGATTFVAARFLKASLRADSELCCRKVYGGIDQAAVARCVAKRGTWYYVAGMGCVRDDARADDPVVYSTVRTVGSLSACTGAYFPRVPVVMCDTFPCPALWTNRPDRDSIHCGSLESDCTKEACCVAPPDTPARCSSYTCDAHKQHYLKRNPNRIVCPLEGCTSFHCCNFAFEGTTELGKFVSPCNAVFEYFPPRSRASGPTLWVIDCPVGQVVQVDIDFSKGGASPGTNLVAILSITPEFVSTTELTGHRHVTHSRTFIIQLNHQNGMRDGIRLTHTCIIAPP